MFRQGEILLVPVEKASGFSARVKRGVLGVGETGNAHVITGDVEWIVSAIDDINRIDAKGAAVARGPVYVQVNETATIEHRGTTRGHEPLTVEPGIYQVKIKREFDPFVREARLVAD